jgi:uncharacterized membrane protein
MTRKNTLMSAAVGSLLALAASGAGTAALAETETEMERCYGIAKAGENDCAAKGHGCQGQAKTDNDPNEWKNVEKGKCLEMGGSLEPGESAA